MQTKPFTTKDLNVPGVEVVTDPKGKVFAGPFYADQIEFLQDTLRGMPKRERYVVTVGENGFYIHRKEGK